MNRQVKAALKGVAIVWGILAVFAALGGSLFLAAAHPWIGVPIWITIIGGFFGWLCENQEEDGW